MSTQSMPARSIRRHQSAAFAKTVLTANPSPECCLQAMAEFPLKREASFLIGDKQTDIDAAHAAGIGGFSVFKGGNAWMNLPNGLWPALRMASR